MQASLVVRGTSAHNIYLHTWASEKRLKGMYEMITAIMSSGITGDFYFLLCAYLNFLSF